MDAPLDSPNQATANPATDAPKSKVESNDVQSDIPPEEWEDGYFGMETGKQLDDDDSDNESLLWDVPESCDDINIDVLSDLPVNVRKGIVEDIRKRERQRKRSFYMPVSDNPSLYSQTQVANFLRTRYEVSASNIGSFL
jgi:hypothetical protein